MEAFDTMLASFRRADGKAGDAKCEPRRKRPRPTPAAAANECPDARLLSLAPFVAGEASGYRERTAPCCDACYARRRVCWHHGDRGLKLLVAGHNPSWETWRKGFAYASPSNSMWRLLAGRSARPMQSWKGVLPVGLPLRAQNMLPATHGVGFLDLSQEPCTDSAALSDSDLRARAPNFYAAMLAHMRRVALWDEIRGEERGDAKVRAGAHAEATRQAASDCNEPSSGVKVEEGYSKAGGVKVEEGSGEGEKTAPDGASEASGARTVPRDAAPLVVAFTGKRQFRMLFPATGPSAAPKQVPYGRQEVLPPDWPLPRSASEVWVLPSPSGRAVLSHAEREDPYCDLAHRIRELTGAGR